MTKIIEHKELDKLSCRNLNRVGPKIEEHLARCDIHTIQDLLFHLPLRYEDRTRLKTISELREGEMGLFEAVVQGTQVRFGQRPSMFCDVSDHTGTLTLRFFHFTAQQQRSLTQGARLRCYGEFRLLPQGYGMIHPEYQFVKPDQPLEVESTLTPVYPTTEGLSQFSLRHLTDQALALLANGALLKDYLPQQVLQEFGLVRIEDALLYVHRPPANASLNQLGEGIHPTQRRLAFEELIAHHLSLRRLRLRLQTTLAPAMSAQSELAKRFLTTLPFQLTNAQQRVIQEILCDLTQSSPMHRLVQGDVGAGKTVVAAIPMLHAVEQGYQVAFMAPTELLALQHAQTLSNWFRDLPIKLVSLSSRFKGKERRETLSAIQSGQAKIVTGTHALFQQEVVFHRLGFVVVDEQHRFGVDQRLALRDKADLTLGYPHQLIMTATPIPRTLAMTAYADLDCSILDELPPGRTPVTTVAIPNHRREEVLERVREVCAQGRQAYWVCTLIEESEMLECQAAEVSAQELAAHLPELKIGLLHGRMTPAVKETIMAAFKAGEFQLLVATTVIEVGIDVANANLMIIENPERLGLAQLHQLRGRVGRGSRQSYCVLLYKSPLSEHAKERIAILRESNDGFVIAQRDLELRGPGEVLGTRQTGLVRFKIADLCRDQELLPDVQKAAEVLLHGHEDVVDNLIRRWLGESEQYGEV